MGDGFGGEYIWLVLLGWSSLRGLWGGRVNVFLVGWWHVWLFGGWGMLLFRWSTRVVTLCCRGGGGLSFGLFRRSCFLPGHDLLLFD